MMIYLFLFSILNRARGSQFWNLLSSTTASRLLATLGMMAVTVALSNNLWMAGLWPLFMLWCTPGWDRYWGACLGNQIINAGGFAPIDWLMSKLWLMPAWSSSGKNYSLRLWGLIAMGLRMTLGVPAVLYAGYITQGNLWISIFTPFLALPYVISGLFKTQYPITYAEYGVGAVLALLLIKTMGL